MPGRLCLAFRTLSASGALCVSGRCRELDSLELRGSRGSSLRAQPMSATKASRSRDGTGWGCLGLCNAKGPSRPGPRLSLQKGSGCISHLCRRRALGPLRLLVLMSIEYQVGGEICVQHRWELFIWLNASGSTWSCSRPAHFLCIRVAAAASVCRGTTLGPTGRQT